LPSSVIAFTDALEDWETLLPKLEDELVPARQREETVHRRTMLYRFYREMPKRTWWEQRHILLFRQVFPNRETFYALDHVAPLLADLDVHLEEDEFEKKLKESRYAITDAFFVHTQQVIARFADLAGCPASELDRRLHVFSYPFPMGDRPILLGSGGPTISSNFRQLFDIGCLTYDVDKSRQAFEILQRCVALFKMSPKYDGDRICDMKTAEKLDRKFLCWVHCRKEYRCVRNLVGLKAHYFLEFQEPLPPHPPGSLWLINFSV
jgi:hypothetical protein